MVKKDVLNANASNWLANHPDVYAVDSEIVEGLHYALRGDTFAVLKGRGVRYCGLHETDELVGSCLDPEVADELQDVIVEFREQRSSGREMAIGRRSRQ